MWRTGQEIDMPVLQVMEEPAMKQETVEEMKEMPETLVVSDVVEGISPRERVQQRTAEVLRPHILKETVEVVLTPTLFLPHLSLDFQATDALTLV